MTTQLQALLSQSFQYKQVSHHRLCLAVTAKAGREVGKLRGGNGKASGVTWEGEGLGMGKQ